ncbi:MAG: GNAT family N-acetyltransferase [Anaerolineales bacterium]|jgi:GNAT superfamily N-acetyltransferase
MSGIDLLDKSALIHELEANLWEMWSTFGCGPGCAIHDEGNALWIENPIPIIPYNGILKFQVERNINQRIDKIVRHYQRRGVEFMWIVHPSSLPPDIPTRLRARKLQEVELIPGMVRSLKVLPEPPPLPKGIEVRKFMGESDAEEYYDFVSWRWGVPEKYHQQLTSTVAKFRFGEPGSKAHMWQAYRDDCPIAKAGMYLTAGSVGIYAVVTKPEARRMGLASILTLTALKAARELDKSLAVLHSTPMAESLYRSLGFETIAHFRLFASVERHI